MVRKCISLLTDFGKESPFPGIMKGVIKKIYPDAEIIDFTHGIRPYDVEEAGFILMSGFHYFPKETIFLVVVDPGVGSERKAVLVKTKNYYFLAPDNGVLSWALEKEKVEKIIWLNNERYFIKPVSDTFHGRDIFAPVAAWLARGEKIENFGEKIKKIKMFPFPKILQKENTFFGKIIYVDRFGNLITNFSQGSFAKKLDKGFSLKIRDKVFHKVSRSYSEVNKGEPALLWDSFGFLEIALREGNLAKTWKVNPQEKVVLRIK